MQERQTRAERRAATAARILEAAQMEFGAHGEGATIRGAGMLDQSLLAQTVARNIAYEAVTDARAPASGVAQGVEANGGRSWTWTRTVTPTADPRIVRVDVGVADATGRTVARLTAVRPPDPASTP